MNKKTLTIIILAVIAVIIAVILSDFLAGRPGKKGGNPYKYEMGNFKSVDPALIHYREIRNITLENQAPQGFCISNDILYITGEQFIRGINPDGVQLFFQTIEDTGTCVEATGEFIFIGFEDHIGKFDKKGKLIKHWQKPGEKTIITSLASKENRIYAADAGNRRVLIYDLDGNIQGEFKGKSESTEGHGFIVPSPNFDLVVNSYGDLWVVNPGKHAIENYTDEGEMRGFWQNSSMEIDGFLGCCNPVELTVLSNGSFVTSEKGIVRIKVYDESGKLLSIVAPPSKFKEDGKAPEIATDSNDLIYALDFDRNRIRIFKKTEL